FVGAQSLVLTKSMDLEKGGNGQHCHFKQGESLPFEPQGILGRGASGQVDKVLSQISFKEYARKRLLRSAATVSNHPELRTFFGCLAAALEFLHGQRVRHKDIKPKNILVHRGNILFTDFGLSLDFTDADSSTTISMVNGMTPKYCAPEVAQYEPRNTMSDIWSLGVVFMEMAVVLKGKTIEFMTDFFREHGSQQ
ncbi:kinase-like protein, partial [Corynespora cassiicola Philippines]